MIREDIKVAEREALCRKEGYPLPQRHE
jgi:hypothetical protein